MSTETKSYLSCAETCSSPGRTCSPRYPLAACGGEPRELALSDHREEYGQELIHRYLYGRNLRELGEDVAR
jgi:hypothetical protein